MMRAACRAVHGGALVLCAMACVDHIPAAPCNLSIEPASGAEGQETEVLIRGDFEIGRVEIDYPRTSISQAISARLGGTQLTHLKLAGDGALSARVPSSLPAGVHALIVTDGRGRDGELKDAFTTISAVDRVRSFRIEGVQDVEIDTALSISVTALDAQGDIVDDFGGHAASSDLTGSMVPTQMGPFISGVWSGDVVITTPADADIITISTLHATTQSVAFATLCPGACPCEVFFVDGDGDQYGDDALTRWACTVPAGHASIGGDCDDANLEAYPGAPEITADGVDQDCDGVDVCFSDVDGDGFGGASMVVDSDLDCANSSSSEAAVDGDCDDTVPAIFPGAVEIAADGVDQNCDGRERCFQDLDGDGYGTAIEVDDTDTDCSNQSSNEADNADDCNDEIAACTVACNTNTDNDVPAVSDCMEVHCGTDPTDPTDTCVLSDGVTLTLEDAIIAANATSGHENILVSYSTTLTGPVTLDSADGACVTLQVAATHRVVINSTMIGLNLVDDGCFIDGVVVENATTGVQALGDGSTLQNIEVTGFSVEGVRLVGANNQLLGSIVHRSSNCSRAAIVVDDVGGAGKPNGNVVADNLIVHNACAAMQLREAPDRTVIDQNTIAFNAEGIRFLSAGPGAKNVCMRNNLITDNTGAALMFDKAATFDQTAACTGALSAGPQYGNSQTANGLGACGGVVCASCSCLPAGTFWAMDIDPAYIESSDATAVTAFCLGETALVDQGADLGYDLNGAQAGAFTGSAPDIGARESGAESCPGL